MSAHRLLCATSWKHSILPRRTRRQRGGSTFYAATRRIVPPQYDGGGWITSTAQRFQSGRGDDNGGGSSTITAAIKEPIVSIFHPPSFKMIQDDEDEDDNNDNKNTTEVANSIRYCISGYTSDDPKRYEQDTGMNVCFLGTSAGIPTRERSTSATVLRVGGSSQSILFDAGEGIQRQLLFSKVNIRAISRIFITHLHGDHLFGLPGLLLGLNNFIKHDRQPQVIKIYGPPGLYNYIAANLILSCSNLQYMTIEIYELLGGHTKRVTRQGERNPFHQSFPEFHHPLLKRRFLSPNTNGIWTIEDIPTRSREEILTTPKKIMQMGHRRISIKAAEVQHVPGVVTFGYAVEEEEPPRNIDPQRAVALGVNHKSKKYNLLKLGFSVQSDDGLREVKPDEVLLPKTKRARKFVLVGDNQGWTPAMMSIAQNTDILVHEATLFDEDQEVGRLGTRPILNF
jgi:ribonuclease Z